MLTGRRGALLAATVALAVAAAPHAPADEDVPVPLLPKQGGRCRHISSMYTKRRGPKRSKKLEAKLRKEGRRNARRGR